MVLATFRRINTDDLQVMDLQYARPDKAFVMTNVAAIKKLVDRDIDLQVLCASIARVLTFGLHLGPTKGRTSVVHDHANAISGSVKGRKRKVPRLTVDYYSPPPKQNTKNT